MIDHELEIIFYNNWKPEMLKKYIICKLYGLYCLKTRGRGGIKPI